MIEALIGLGGVIVGSAITVSKDVWIARLERRRNASFAAMRIIGVLDQFVETCVDVVFDDGTIQGQLAGRTKDGQEYAIAQVQCPSGLSFPEDLEWKSLGNSLMYQVLALPPKVNQANRYVDYWANNSFGPDADDFFEARQESFAELGLEAIELSGQVRRKFGIPDHQPPAWNPDWDPKKFLLDKKKSIAERNKRSPIPLEGTEDGN